MLHDGRVMELADPGMRMPHAGPCITPNANSTYYGIAAATDRLRVVLQGNEMTWRQSGALTLRIETMHGQ